MANQEEQIPPVLIIGYKRTANIEQILDFCESQGVGQIFLYLDGLASTDVQSKPARYSFLERLRVRGDTKTKLSVKVIPENQGCAVSVLDSVTWALEFNESIVVLEDDCLPTKAFFDFIGDAQRDFRKSPDLWTICGTQFAPRHSTNGKAFMSPYALTWGWFTTKAKWDEIRRAFVKNASLVFQDSQFSTSPETCFWSAGARRALSGYTDVWDTVLLYCMQKESKQSLLPGISLVRNVGNDAFAVHTSQDSRWTNQEVGAYAHQDSFESNNAASLWLKRHFFKIRRRHLVTTKINIVLDLFRRKKFSEPLSRRLSISVWN